MSRKQNINREKAVDASEDLSKFSTEIKKTGFPLEFETTRVLERGGWSYINNKYYVDDLEENVREIDVVAYRATETKNFDVYTVLVISCKKSDANVWAMLSRKNERVSLNVNAHPLFAWTNDKALSHMNEQPTWPQEYYESVRALGAGNVMGEPTVDIFAFQEMNKSSGAPNNDKQIFSSITSLMKAQAYEYTRLAPEKRHHASTNLIFYP